MAGMNDLAQQIAFYESGGGRPKPMESFTNAFNATAGVGEKYLSIINDVLKNKKLEQESIQLEQNNKPVTEVVGTPLVKSQISQAENAPIPPEDMASGVLNSRQAGLDRASKTAHDVQDKFGSATVGQYKDLAQAQNWLEPNAKSTAPNDERGLSSIISFMDAKKILPSLTEQEYATMRVGGFNALVGRRKDEDLEARSGRNLDLRLSNSVMAAGNNLNMLIRPIREQKMAILGSDELANAIKSGNTVAAAAIGAKQAKVVGDTGALSKVDVTRYVQSGWLPQRVGDILGQWLATGTPTDATVDEIIAVNKAMATALDLKEKEIIREAASRLVENYGMDFDDAMKRLGKSQGGGGGRVITLPDGSTAEVED